MIIFLHKMKFFKKILFLIINLFNDFNAVILNKIHLKLKYDDFNENVKKTLITQFLKLIHENLKSLNINTKYINYFIKI
jgi:hypothetical protein